MKTDLELLNGYVGRRSEDDFRALVDRYVNLVWSAARRITDNNEIARDVTQTVFVMGFIHVVRTMSVDPARMPASEAELRERAARFNEWAPSVVDVLFGTSQYGGLYARTMEVFEFMPRPTPSDQHLKHLILREREPRVAPEGGWVRAYGTTHGLPIELTSLDHDFTTVERAFEQSVPPRFPVSEK